MTDYVGVTVPGFRQFVEQEADVWANAPGLEALIAL